MSDERHWVAIGKGRIVNMDRIIFASVGVEITLHDGTGTSFVIKGNDKTELLSYLSERRYHPPVVSIPYDHAPDAEKGEGGS